MLHFGKPGLFSLATPPLPEPIFLFLKGWTLRGGFCKSQYRERHAAFHLLFLQRDRNLKLCK